MSSELLLTETGLKILGPLQFDTVSSLLSAANKELDGMTLDSIVIDLEKVDRIDSAGVSLLLEWKRQIESKHKTFLIQGMQNQVISLLTTYKLQSLLK